MLVPNSRHHPFYCVDSLTFARQQSSVNEGSWETLPVTVRKGPTTSPSACSTPASPVCVLASECTGGWSGRMVKTMKYLHTSLCTWLPGRGVGSCGPLRSTLHTPKLTFVLRECWRRLWAAPCQSRLLASYRRCCHGSTRSSPLIKSSSSRGP